MLALLVPQALSSRRRPLSLYQSSLALLLICDCSAHRMYGTELLPVRRDSLPLATRKVCSDFNTVFVPLLLLAAGVGFHAACF